MTLMKAGRFPTLTTMTFVMTPIMTLVVTFIFSQAQADFQVPPLTGPVVDQAGLLDRGTEERIDQALRFLRDQGGSQLTVLTVPSLEGLPIEQASIRVTDQWKLGGAKMDNGVLLMIAQNERRVRIEVGQGLEGVLTDVDSKRIIEDSILPLFRAGDYPSGIVVGVHQIARKTDPTIDLSPYLEGVVRDRVPRAHSPIKGWIIIAMVLLFLLLGGGGRRRRGIVSSGWPGGFSGGGGGGWGGGSSSRRGGGGWSGGGGGFSGGGASGGW